MKSKRSTSKIHSRGINKVKGYTAHVDNNDMGNLIVTNKYTPENRINQSILKTKRQNTTN